MLNHPNIVPIVEEFETENKKICVIYDLYLKGNFETLQEKILKIKQKGKKFMKEKEILELFYQICNAMRYLHDDELVVHRDFYPDSIYLMDDGTLMVGDLCKSKRLMTMT